ncbi:MAG: phage portal protein [Candidatus Riflebacteria bacterium]|nr:phage portal protein [Candidatus Riflebacteria bacterium]
MAYKDLDSATVSDLRSIEYTAGYEPWNVVKDAYDIGSQDTETNNYVCDWRKWHGIYRKVPLVKAVIDKLGMYTVGKGYKAKTETAKKTLERIRGDGKDTFNSIMFNGIRTMKTGGEFFAEAPRDKANRLLNLKPINPGSVNIVSNKRGIIQHYEQVIIKNNAIEPMKDERGNHIIWQPDEMFHLRNWKIADETHGIPLPEALLSSIKQFLIATDDMTVVFHRYVKPLLLWILDTDDTTEIGTFRAKAEEMKKYMEDMYIPKETASLERMSIPQYSTLDPIPWIKMTMIDVIRAGGVPEIVLGHSEEESEATAKMLYLAFQQTIEWEQRYIIDQIKAQLGLEVEFEFPASIDPAIMADTRKNSGEKLNKTIPKAGTE